MFRLLKINISLWVIVIPSLIYSINGVIEELVIFQKQFPISHSESK